jgi:phosphoglycerate dehydrogenase-like enzyme
VAEHAILLILAVYKQLPRADSSLRSGEWLQFGLRAGSFELAGKTLGLVGFGRIGYAVALRARAFEVNICYTDIQRRAPEEERALGASYLPSEELLALSDIISLHLPATPETYRIIDEKALRRIKTGSILINTSRGSLVNQQALVAALQNGHLGGAGLHVFEREPPEQDDPLLKLSNVVLTPHIAAGTRDALIAKMDAAFANMLHLIQGESPLHLVGD